MRFSNGAAAYHAASKVRADDAVPHAGGRLVVGGRVLLVKLRLDGGGEVLVQLVLAEDLFRRGLNVGRHVLRHVGLEDLEHVEDQSQEEHDEATENET